MHDYDSGLDQESLEVRASFVVNGIAAGENLTSKFQPKSPGVWELKLTEPIRRLPAGLLTVAVRDREGNWSRIERKFRVE